MCKVEVSIIFLPKRPTGYSVEHSTASSAILVLIARWRTTSRSWIIYILSNDMRKDTEVQAKSEISLGIRRKQDEKRGFRYLEDSLSVTS